MDTCMTKYALIWTIPKCWPMPKLILLNPDDHVAMLISKPNWLGINYECISVRFPVPSPEGRRLVPIHQA